jgi:N-methylhydantoinase B
VRVRANRIALTAVLDGAVFENGAVSRRRIWRLNPADADNGGINEDDVVELDTRRAALLRGWARLDAAVKPETVPTDERGLSILKATVGDYVQLRRIAAKLQPRSGFAAATE